MPSGPSKDCRELALFLESLKLDHFVDMLLQKGYSMANIHLLTEFDLNKLRVTNKTDRAGLLYAAKAMREEQDLPEEQREERRRQRLSFGRPVRRGRSPQRGGARRGDTSDASAAGGGGSKSPSGEGIVMETLADGTVAMKVADGEAEIPEFTATIQTANEHARQATIFLCHHRVDRPWPKAGSKLAQNLHLANASQPNYGPMYSINLDGETSTVHPPHKCSQGFSARFCKTCQDFVSEAMHGAWQYQQLEKVIIGDGVTEDVLVWKPFHQNESMRIEYAHKRRNPSVKIRAAVLDFDAMLWGDKAVRRVDSDAVPFPTLRRKDLVVAPPPDMEPREKMQMSIAELQRQLVSDTEEKRSRLYIEQLEQKGLADVLAGIALIMDEYHHGQRAALEAEEEAARALIEGKDFEAALDKLYDFEEQSVRNVALRKWEKASEAITRQQCGLLEEMEAAARLDVEADEAAFRRNLEKLLAMFNDQIRAFLDKKRRKAEKYVRDGDGLMRCPVCRKTDCVFFRHPWKGQWKAVGGALDLHAPPQLAQEQTLSQLVGKAAEVEYTDHLKNRQARRSQSKAKARLMTYINQSSAAASGGDATNLGVHVARSTGAATAGGGGLPSPIQEPASFASGASPDDEEAAGRRRPMSAVPRSRSPGVTGAADDSGAAEAGHHPRAQSAASGRRAVSPVGFRSAVASASRTLVDSVNRLTKRAHMPSGSAVNAVKSEGPYRKVF